MDAWDTYVRDIPVDDLRNSDEGQYSDNCKLNILRNFYLHISDEGKIWIRDIH